MNIDVVTTRMYFAVAGTITFAFADEPNVNQVMINSFYGTDSTNLDAMNFLDMQQNLIGSFMGSSVIPADQKDKVQIAGVTVTFFAPLGVHEDDKAFFKTLHEKQAADALKAGEQALEKVEPEGEA